MPYFRRPKNHEHPYAQISNDMLNDPELSFKAKGLLSYLLAQSDEWEVYQSQLAELGPDGEASVRSGLKELREQGYLERNRLHADDGTFDGYEYIVYEYPTGSGKTDMGKPDTGKSETGKSDPNNTNLQQDKEKQHEDEAPAHEGSSVEDVFQGLVDAWRAVRPAPTLTEKRERVLYDWAHDGTVEDPVLFREVLEEQAADTSSKGVGLSMGILLKEYRKQRDAGKLEPWQKEDERYSINEDGEPCFKGKPLSEIGPQNVYDDIDTPA
jgi:hypothetical protein